jgi:hypothetical protein
MKNVLFIFWIFAVFIAVVVAGFFLLGIPQTALYISALIFLLVSLVISMLSLVAIKRVKEGKDGLYYSVGTIVIIWIYQITVVVMTPLAHFFDNYMSVFIFIEIMLLAFYAVGTFVVNAAARKVHRMNEETSAKQESAEYDKAKRGGY